MRKITIIYWLEINISLMYSPAGLTRSCHSICNILVWSQAVVPDGTLTAALICLLLTEVNKSHLTEPQV